jgi:hypothetical protein
MDLELLKQTLIWIAFSGGSGIVTYLLWEQLEKWFVKVDELPVDAETYITLAITGVFATAAYLIMVAMGYTPTPDTAKMWIEAIFAVLGPAVGVTKVLHGVKKGKERK